jgi:hypothetical protein
MINQSQSSATTQVQSTFQRILLCTKYHFLREHVVEQSVKLEYIATKEQVVDIFTKPLSKETFEYLRQKLGVISLSYHQ